MEKINLVIGAIWVTVIIVQALIMLKKLKSSVISAGMIFILTISGLALLARKGYAFDAIAYFYIAIVGVYFFIELFQWLYKVNNPKLYEIFEEERRWREEISNKRK